MAVTASQSARRRVTTLGVAVATAATAVLLALATGATAQAATVPAPVSSPGGWVGLTSTNVYAGTRVNVHGGTGVVGWCQRSVVIQQHVSGTWSRTVSRGLTSHRGFYSLPVPTASGSYVNATYTFRAVVLAGCGKPQWVSAPVNLTILPRWNMGGPAYRTGIPVGTTPANIVGWIYDKEGCVLTATLQQHISGRWVNIRSTHTNTRGDYGFPEDVSKAGSFSYRVGVPNSCGHSAQMTDPFTITIR